MMVLPATAVECAAKIAMTTLPGVAAAVGLLPNHHPLRIISLGPHMVRIFNLKMSSRTRCVSRARNRLSGFDHSDVASPHQEMSFFCAHKRRRLLSHRAAQQPIILQPGPPGLTIEAVLWHTVPRPCVRRKTVLSFRVKHARTQAACL
jgi:hypothetical protein